MSQMARVFAPDERQIAHSQTNSGMVPLLSSFCTLGGVQGSKIRIHGSKFRVHGLGFRVQDSGFRVQGSGFRVHVSEFRV